MDKVVPIFEKPVPGRTPRRKHILLLDDDPPVLRLLSAHLRGPNVQIITCREIEAAECLMNEFRCQTLVTDLKVSSLGDLEGMRLIRYVATNFPETRIIVFSGLIDSDVRQMAFALGASEVLRKPADLKKLVEMVYPERKEMQDASRLDPRGEIIHVHTLDEILEGEFVHSVLQPIVPLQSPSGTNEFFAVESLARGPENSPLRSPEVLLAYASLKQKLVEIEELCINAALREVSKLPQEGLIFINTRPRSLSNPRFARRLVDAVARSQFDPEQVVLELTEQQSIVNPPAFSSSLEVLRKQGFRIALDDFGEAFSNLHLVLDLRPDFLKLSGLLCRDINQDLRKQIIVRKVTEMAHELGIPTIMEQVETVEELETVRKIGVEYGQGYYFARPNSAAGLSESFFLDSPSRTAAK